MAYINVPEGMPGIRGLMAFRPETARPLNLLAEALLQAPSTLSKGDRELIATYVSKQNECRFCASTHGAIARHLLDDDRNVDSILSCGEPEQVSPKLRALLNIAGKVKISGKAVEAADIEAAKAEGATDIEIHDTVLIAAAFCMFNRYVDGLGTQAPDDRNVYDQIGAYRAKVGYLAPNNELKP